MNIDEYSDVLIDQNRNSVHPRWPNSNIMHSKELLNHVDRATRSNPEVVHCQFNNGNEIKPNTTQNSRYSDAIIQPHIVENKENTFYTLQNCEKEDCKQEHSVKENTEEAIVNEEHVNCDTDVEKKWDSCYIDAVKMRASLVKTYAWIKEEMSKTSAKSIAAHLYKNEQKLISRNDYESIAHCEWRRDAVEQLLKKVLMGPNDIYQLFIDLLSKQEERHIAQKVLTTIATEQEIHDFQLLEQHSLQQGPRPDSHEPRLTFTESDIQTLLYFLNNKNIIDSLNDNLLSRFIFSIREHTNICHCSLDHEKRVNLLIDTMRNCADKIFLDIWEIMHSNEMEHVIKKLEKRLSHVECKQRQKRKIVLVQENITECSSSFAKRQFLSSTTEHCLVSSLQKSSTNMRQHALDELAFDVENVNKGSVVIQLCPRSADSWKKLEENCLTGKIKDFIPKVYNNEAIQDMLTEGEYRLKFTIYILPTHPDKEEDKKVLFHLETESDKSKEQPDFKENVPIHHDNAIEEHMNLLCEELEITKDLLKLLKEKKIVDDNIKQEIDKQGSRRKQIKFLLQKVSAFGMAGYEVLKNYIKNENTALHKALVTTEELKVINSKLDTSANVTKPRSSSSSHRAVFKKEVFFTGTVVLLIKKNTNASKENLCSDSAETNLEITCPEILNPVCHFQAKGQDDVANSGEVTLVLEDAWSTVGTGQAAPQRDILVGKRKQKKAAKGAETEEPNQKKQHSTEERDTDEEDTQTDNIDLKDKDTENATTESNAEEKTMENVEHASAKKG